MNYGSFIFAERRRKYKILLFIRLHIVQYRLFYFGHKVTIYSLLSLQAQSLSIDDRIERHRIGNPFVAFLSHSSANPAHLLQEFVPDIRFGYPYVVLILFICETLFLNRIVCIGICSLFEENRVTGSAQLLQSFLGGFCFGRQFRTVDNVHKNLPTD